MSSQKLVSIVLPIYNGAKYMSLSIDSIINQTYKNWELIIIDDCSTDNTPEIAKKYVEQDNRITYFRNEKNLKLPKGLNKGFSLAKGEYLTWTSDDNLYFPNAIEKMVDTLIATKTDFVFAACDIINEKGEVIEYFAVTENYKEDIIRGNCVGACFMYTKKVYEEIGDYNPERFLVEDYDYWLRVFAKFKISSISETLYQYRFHSGALTSTEKKERINDMCEKVILDNLSLFGKLSLLQKYYLYERLNELRKIKENKEEQLYYRKKYNKYRWYYVIKVLIPQKIKRLICK